jgi:hypothetical protein
MKTRALSCWLLGVLLLLGCLQAGAWCLTPTPDPRADLDNNGLINIRDLFIFNASWHLVPPTPTETFNGPTYTPTPSPTITETPTLTPTPTITETPTLTPTLSFNGRVFGIVTDQQSSETVPFYQLFLDLPDPFDDQNGSSDDGGFYEFTGLPIGVQATLKNNVSVQYADFQIPIVIAEDLEQNIELVVFTPTPSATMTETPTETPTITDTGTATATRTNSGTPTITQTPTITATRTDTGTPTPSNTGTTTRTATPTRTFTPAPPTRTPTPTPVPLANTSWAGLANISGGIKTITMANDPGLNPSQMRVHFDNESFVNTVSVTGAHFSFPGILAEGSTGAFLSLDGTFIDSNTLSGDMQYRSGVGQPLINGTYTMTRE